MSNRCSALSLALQALHGTPQSKSGDKADLQAIFEDHDLKQSELLKNYIHKINEQEKIILKLKRAPEPCCTQDLKSLMDMETQTTGIPLTNSTLLLDIALMKKKQELMEQSIMELKNKVNNQSTTPEHDIMKKRYNNNKLENKIVPAKKKLYKCFNSNVKSIPERPNKYLTQKQSQVPQNFLNVSLQVQKLKDSHIIGDSPEKSLMANNGAGRNSVQNLNDPCVTLNHPQELNNSKDLHILPPNQTTSPLPPAHNNNYIITEAQVHFPNDHSPPKPKWDDHKHFLDLYPRKMSKLKLKQTFKSRTFVNSCLPANNLTYRHTSNLKYLTKTSMAFTDTDLLVLTEHGLNKENVNCCRIPGYATLGGFTREKHRKGGVIAYVKQELEDQFSLVKTSDQITERICEVSHYKLITNRSCLLILGVYRPPSSKLDDAIEILTAELDEALTSNQAIIIMGDINVDSLRDDEQKKRN
ncbi:hypothetical protein J6590_005818 [Homalodisca vitripennis]|nr:hypothetical protein J6590_005818 [Homalodisca vitripennis]